MCDTCVSSLIAIDNTIKQLETNIIITNNKILPEDIYLLLFTRMKCCSIGGNGR